MDETKTAAILAALAQGVNPFTGEVFSADSPYQHADVVRALYAAIERFSPKVEAEERRPARRTRTSSNVGKPWSEAEDRCLLAGFDHGRKPNELARELGRTLAGIEARLEKHGRLQPNERKTANRYRPEPVPRAAATSLPGDLQK